VSRNTRWFIPVFIILAGLLSAGSADARRGTYLVQQDRKAGKIRTIYNQLRGKELRVTRRGIRSAQKRIARKVNLPTPLVHSPSLSKRYGVEVYLKLESATPVGSFKIRGAVNKVLSLRKSVRKRGVVAASTGNHAQGVAWAARASGIEATIVMPDGASPLKANKTKKLGGTVKIAGENYGKSVDIAKELARTNKGTFISGYADRKVIEGQGTIGREILKQMPDADWVIGALGGGGLMGGISSAGQGLKKRPTFIGVQSGNNSPMFETLRNVPGKARLKGIKPTIADGTLVTAKPNPKMVKLLRKRLDMVVKVSERSAERAVLDLNDRGHRIEGAGALPLAGLERALKDLRRPGLKGIKMPRKVVLVMSGGNIDQHKLDSIRQRHNRPAATNIHE